MSITPQILPVIHVCDKKSETGLNLVANVDRAQTGAGAFAFDHGAVGAAGGDAVPDPLDADPGGFRSW